MDMSDDIRMLPDVEMGTTRLGTPMVGVSSVEPTLVDYARIHELQRSADRGIENAKVALSKVGELDLPVPRQAPDDFFLRFEDIAAAAKIPESEWESLVQRKIGPGIQSALLQHKGGPYVGYEQIRDAVCSIWGHSDPLWEYRAELAALRCSSAVALEQEFGLILRKYNRALLRIRRAADPVRGSDEVHIPQRELVRFMMNALPERIRREVSSYLNVRRALNATEMPLTPADLFEVARSFESANIDSFGERPVLLLQQGKKNKPKTSFPSSNPRGRDANHSPTIKNKRIAKSNNSAQSQKKGQGGSTPASLVRNSKKEQVCFLCHQPGHFVANCPRNLDRKPSELFGTTRCWIHLAGMKVQATIDTGSPISLVHSDLVLRLKDVSIQKCKRAQLFVGADGSKFLLDSFVELSLKFCKLLAHHQFLLCDSVPATCILGVDALAAASAYIDMKNLMLTVNLGREEIVRITNDRDENVLRAAGLVTIPAKHQRFVRVTAPTSSVFVSATHGSAARKNLLVASGELPCDTPVVEVLVMNNANSARDIFPGEILAVVEAVSVENVSDNVGTEPTPTRFSPEEILQNAKHLSHTHHRRLRSLIVRFADLFGNTPRKDVTGKTVHRVDTGDVLPIASPPYRVTPERREFMRQEVREMLETGVISESSSPWASPVVLVPKKDGSVRFCVDYRKLNTHTKRDVYPLPVIEDVLTSMQGMKWFSSLDLAQGYWQVPLAPDAKEKSAFITPDGLYEFNVMPFGMTNAPATFQRMMDCVLAGIKWKSCLVYLDDIIIFSTGFDRHLSDLEDVFTRIRKAHLVVKPKKCDWCTQSIRYLGHIIGADGVRPDPDKVLAVQSMTEPDSLKKLQAYLGFIGYYRRFVRNFARVANPLYRLLRANVQWVWGKDQKAAFQTLNAALASAVKLVHPDFTLPFVVDTDASKEGLGAVLSQIRNGVEEPIAFASRALTEGERKWHCCEFEALAAVWGIKTFAPYVGDRQFTLRVDHHNLRWLQIATHSRLQRWALELQEFNYVVEYRRGVEHCNCDGLSRNPITKQHTTDVSGGKCTVCTTPAEPVLLALPTGNSDCLVLDELRRAQQADCFCKEAIASCLCAPPYVDVGGVDGKAKRFCYQNDLLFLVCGSALRPVLRLVVPDKISRARILAQYHTSELAGHLGVGKTYQRVVDRFYWRGMFRDVQTFVRQCQSCQLRKTRPHRYGYLHPISVKEPWEVVGMDLFGELPTTSRGNRYVLVMIDHFTKWPEVIPLRRIDALTIANCLHKHLICRHGCPRKLLTDRGAQFMSQVVIFLCKRYGISKVFTTAYHPQGDPQSEAFMKVLGNTLSVLSQERNADWDEFTDSIAFACRTAVHPTTRYTPFYLNHLREAKFPFDREVEAEIGPIPNFGGPNLEESRFKVMQSVRRQVHELIRDSQNSSKVRYDRNRLESPLAIGDLALVQKPPGLVGKLDNRWSGPFEVEQISSDGLVHTLRNTKTNERTRVHVSRLCRFQRGNPEVESFDEEQGAYVDVALGNSKSDLNQGNTSGVSTSQRRDTEVQAGTESGGAYVDVARTSEAETDLDDMWYVDVDMSPKDVDAIDPIESSSNRSPKPVIGGNNVEHELVKTHSMQKPLDITRVTGYDLVDGTPTYRVVQRDGSSSWEPESELTHVPRKIVGFKRLWNQRNPDNPFTDV